mgnify:CR=1 FL=1
MTDVFANRSRSQLLSHYPRFKAIHMLSSLIDLSLQNRFLVITLTLLMAVAGINAAINLPIDAVPDMTNVRAFLAGPTDAICIHRNVWHAGLTVLDGPAEFAMMMWRATAGDDGIVHTLDTPLKLSID